MLLELIERRTEFFFDLGRVLVLGDIEDLAEIAVTLLKETRVCRRVKPDLQQWHQGLGNVVLELSVGLQVNREW